jgi:hypothetical protein
LKLTDIPDTRFTFPYPHHDLELTYSFLQRTTTRRREWEIDTVAHLQSKANRQESVTSSKHEIDSTTNENWPAGRPNRPGTSSVDSSVRKAVFDPATSEMQDEDEVSMDGSEMSSVADTDEWIGEDDRASDSIPPSILSELESQRHRLLMQQPPRSSISKARRLICV